jgi:cytochrome P450
VPGSRGLPLIGHTLELLRDGAGLCRRMAARFGPNFRLEFAGAPMVVVGEPDRIRDVLLDRERAFSNQMGWQLAIGELFAGGLMLRDFDEHHEHRRIMQVAFRPQAIAGYLERLNPLVASSLARWSGRIEAYAAIKQLALDIAADVFLGISLGPDAQRVNRHFIDMVAASMAVVRREVPGLGYHRGMRARRALLRYFESLLPERRRSDGTDLFSQLARARNDEGQALGDREIIEHMIFLMMAAHDTTASSLSSLLWALAQYPTWQARLAEPMRKRPEPFLDWSMRDQFSDFDLCFNEALRLYPPVAFVARRTTQAVQLGSLQLPRNSHVTPCALVAHYLPDYWSEPLRFDPERFDAARAEHRRHSHSYLPFGGGAHTCIGMGFARLVVRAIVYQLLRRYQLQLVAGYRLDMQVVPIAKPRGGLPLILR